MWISLCSILQMDADALLPIQRVKLAFVAVFFARVKCPMWVEL